jgi:protease IV
MKRGNMKRNRFKATILTIVAVFFVVFVLLPLTLSIFDDSKSGNVALMAVNGMITVDGGNYLGSSTTSSKTVTHFISEAIDNPQIEVILIEINSPGGSAVASDEIALAVKKSEKPVVALIREVGASGGYWIASATDHVIANRMSITGSIGVLSSFLEFSGLMEQYGVNYEQLTAGEYKDIGTPFRKLNDNEKSILQKKINKIHDFFIEEIVENRKLSENKVKQLATGEFFLGVEALELGLVDQLGNRDTAETFIKETYNIESVDYLVYEREASFFDLLSSVLSKFSFNVGEGLGSILLKQDNNLILV